MISWVLFYVIILTFWVACLLIAVSVFLEFPEETLLAALVIYSSLQSKIKYLSIKEYDYQQTPIDISGNTMNVDILNLFIVENLHKRLNPCFNSNR